MKEIFVFGNPTKGTSVKTKTPVKSEKGKSMGLLAKLKKHKKESVKTVSKPVKKKATKKSKTVIKDVEMDLLKSIKENGMAKKKGKKKVAKKSSPKKKAIKKSHKKKASVKKPSKKKAHKKKSHKKKKAAVAPAPAPKKKKRKAHKKKAVHSAPKKKRKASKKKAKSNAAPKKKRKSHKKKSHAKRFVYQKGMKLSYKKIKRGGKKAHYRKNKKGTTKFMYKRLNPLGGAMSKLEKFTGMSMPEAGGLLIGGLAYGAVNSILAKIPVVSKVHAQLVKIPVVGSALPTLLAGALCNFIGDKKNIKALKMIGTGLVGAAVVGMGVNASQLVPGLKGMAGVDYTMGDEADFGDDDGQMGDEADFGELISENYEALSGVDYTMNGVDYTMGDEADFGELISQNDEALSGGQLG